MRIAQLTTHINSGGIPSYILTLAANLKKQGVDSVVFSSGGNAQPLFDAATIRCFSFPIKTKFAFHPKLLFVLPEIIQRMKDEKIELIHAHTRVGQVLAALISKRCGIPYVSTCHGFYEPRFGRRIFPAWGKKVIAISSKVKQDLIERHGLSAEQVITIYNGVEVEQVRAHAASFNPVFVRNQFGFLKDDFVACTVARLVEEKGVADFVEAALRLMPKFPRLKVLIAGEGREQARLEARVREAQFADRFVFTGRLNDIGKVLAAGDVFIHPARWVEAFGLSIVEAMSAGLPVLMTRHWALFDLLQDARCCSFVEKEDVDQIAAAIKEWIDDPALVVEMGRAAYLTAKRYFDAPLMAEQIAGVYRGALSQANR